MPGPLALVGAGEYLPVMLEVERDLIAGRPPRYVQLPTAAGREGSDRLRYWTELGQAQAERLGVTAVPLVVTSREQADDPTVAAAVDGAGLIYLSGGSPGYLADTLRGTLLWHAIVAAWTAGAALAGCSAGAMALSDRVPDLRHPSGGGREGLGLLPHLRVLPHFDRMVGRLPDLLSRPFLRPTPGVSLIGIDENTALVSDGAALDTYVVRGVGSVWLLGHGRRRQYSPGAVLRLPVE